MNSASNLPQKSPRSCSSQAGGHRVFQHKKDEGSPSIGQRSVSLTTLQQSPTTVIQPRMAQLETLEAKMASIEVSLSSTPRRKKNGSLNGKNSVVGASIRSIPKELAAKELENLRASLREKDVIQNNNHLTMPTVLRLHDLKNNNQRIGPSRSLTDSEKKQAEERLGRLKIEVDNKRKAIVNLKIALERLDITDNIDVRIQQAELEYQLGREELNLLTLLEDSRALQICLDESNRNSSEAHTLYHLVNGSDHVILQAVEVNYDPQSPKFVAGQKENTPGLWIDWALEETGLLKGDRLVEVNGKIILNKNREDLMRLLAAAPDPAQVVLLRKITENGNSRMGHQKSGAKEVAALRSELEMVRERAEEAQRTKEGLRSDNIRLTHRISYLEEQVSELLCRRNSEEGVRVVTPVISTVKTNQNITNINITSNQKEVQQQNGVISVPIRSKSSLSNVSNTIISSGGEYNCHKSHRHKHRVSRNGLHSSLSNQTLDQNSEKAFYRKHHHHHKDYNSDANSNEVSRHNKRNTAHNNEPNIMDQSYKKATKIVHELTRADPTPYEKHRQKCLTASEKYNTDLLKHYNARKSTSVLDFRSEVHIGPKYPPETHKSVEDILETTASKSTTRLYKKIQNSRSVKSLDFDSDCNSTSTNLTLPKSIDYTSEPIEHARKLSYYQPYFADGKPRPTPPKKPLRLSLHKTQSLQSVETPPTTPPPLPTNHDLQTNKHESRKSVKRTYKSEGQTKLLDSNREFVRRDLKWLHCKMNGEEKASWC